MKRGTSVLVLGVSLIMMLGSCGVKLHEYFGYSSVTKDIYAFANNDSAMVQLKAPGDIDFITDESLAKTFLKKEWELNSPENILFVGKSNVEPFYSFIIMMDNKEELDHPDFSGIRIMSFQRLIGGHKFNLFAHSEAPNLRPKDFEFMLDNLKMK